MEGVPRTIGWLLPVILFLLLVAGRVVASEIFRGYGRIGRETSRVLIYGAGMAGRQLASAARSGREMTVIGYIDDNPDLAGRTIDAYPVFSMPEVAEVVASRRITHIMLAVPSRSEEQTSEIQSLMR